MDDNKKLEWLKKMVRRYNIDLLGSESELNILSDGKLVPGIEKFFDSRPPNQNR